MIVNKPYDISELSREVDKKLSIVINRYYSSTKFDLGIILDEEVIIKLRWYQDILNRIDKWKPHTLLSLKLKQINELF